MTYETIQLAIPNRKNLQLATEIFKPDGVGPFPVVMLFHGFTGYKEDAGLVNIAEKLAENGIVSIRFTSSGFGDSEGALAQEYLFSNYRQDAESVYSHVMRLPYIEPKRLGVYGHSMGGKLAILFCADRPEIRAVCIGSAPVSFVGTAYEAELAAWKERGYFEKVSGRDNATIRIPYAYVTDEEAPAHDVLAAAARVASPHALVIAGDADIEVPWQQTKRIYDVLPCKKVFEVLQGVPHKYSKAPSFIQTVIPLITDFFVKTV